MDFKDIFNVFSKGNKEPEPFTYSISKPLRNKVLLYVRDLVSGSRRASWGSAEDYTVEFWNEIHQTLLYRHGRLALTEGSQSRIEDAVRFLLTCKDEEFLDFIEYIFKVKCLFHITVDENELVNEINQLFLSEDAGYELTPMLKEEFTEPVDGYPFFGRELKVIKTLAYPKIIRKDSQVIHATAMKPVLGLLSEPSYKTANNEFLEALDDYRKGDYGDCLTKCCSAFESVMKIICDRKRWDYKQTDTAGTLIGTVIKNSGLDSFLEQPLMIVATLRNRLSKSHGAGVRAKDVSQHLARYALNSTASAILLLLEKTK